MAEILTGADYDAAIDEYRNDAQWNLMPIDRKIAAYRLNIELICKACDSDISPRRKREIVDHYTECIEELSGKMKQ